MKKLLAVLLAFTFALGSISADSTPKFKDIDEVKWAKKYIEEAAKRGIVKGYEDGNFKPKKNVTKCNSLLMIYRMLDSEKLVDTKKEEKIKKSFTEAMNKADIPTYGKLREAISYFLYHDILAESRLETFMEEKAGKNGKAQNKITRQEVCYYLGQALNEEINGDVDAKIETDLSDFKDANTINSTYRPYISLLHQYDIVSGDDKKMFNPNHYVTRAEFSKLISASMEVLENPNKVENIEIKAEIKRINAEDKKLTLEFKIKNSPVKEKTIDKDVLIYIDDEKSTFEDLEVGMNVVVIYEKYKYQDKKLELVEIRAESIKEENNSLGVVSDINRPKNKIFYKDEHNDKGDIELNSNIKLYLDKIEVPFDKVKKGQHIAAIYRNGKLSAIELLSKNASFKGIIKKVDLDNDTLTLEIEKKEVNFDIPKGTIIKKVGKAALLEDLTVGNTARLTSEYGKITKISTEPKIRFGNINALFKGDYSKGTKNSIQILFDDNSLETFELKDDIIININGKPANSMFDLKLDSNVSLSFDGNELIKIDSRSYGNKISLTGYITNVDVDENFIVVEALKNNVSSENFTYYLILDDAKIIDYDGDKIRTKHLKEWEKVFFYGNVDRDEDDNSILRIEKLMVLEKDK